MGAAEKRLRVVFYCGHQSPFGLAHLDPILESRFEVVEVVLAADSRWNHFRRKLRGITEADEAARAARPESNRASTLGAIAALVKLPAKIVHEQITAWRARAAEEPAAPQESVLRRRGVTTLVVDDANTAAVTDHLRSLKPDLILSAAYPQIFSADLIGIPTRGSVNFHPSLLPKFRGAHPHFWAIATGERETGVTAHFMTPRLDDGDIVAQITVPIEGCVYDVLYERLTDAVPPLVSRVEAFFVDGGQTATPQDHAKATTFRNDRDIHHRIFWSLHPAETLHNLIRTQKAFCFLDAVRVGLLDSTIQPTNRNLTNAVKVDSATVVDINSEGFVVKALDACIQVRKTKSGMGLLSASEWAARVGLEIGRRFE